MTRLAAEVVPEIAGQHKVVVGIVDPCSVPLGSRLFDKLLAYGLPFPESAAPLGKDIQLTLFLQRVQNEAGEWERDNPVERFGKFLASMPNSFADILLTMHSVLENITLARVSKTLPHSLPLDFLDSTLVSYFPLFPFFTNFFTLG